jgi:hypothetical protein
MKNANIHYTKKWKACNNSWRRGPLSQSHALTFRAARTSSGKYPNNLLFLTGSSCFLKDFQMLAGLRLSCSPFHLPGKILAHVMTEIIRVTLLATKVPFPAGTLYTITRASCGTGSFLFLSPGTHWNNPGLRLPTSAKSQQDPKYAPHKRAWKTLRFAQLASHLCAQFFAIFSINSSQIPSGY